MRCFDLVSSSFLRAAAAAAASAAIGCGPQAPAGDGGDAAGDPTGPGGEVPCVNLACQQVDCPGGGTTRLSGRVFTPAGDLPLPNVSVYVPNRSLAPIDDGAACTRCETEISGSPLVETRTDAEGRFALADAPVGPDIPLVMQIGKWRRAVRIPLVRACEDNRLDDPEMTRLPRDQSEGHIPRIAVTTGGADALECLLRKVGVADSEFTPEGAGGRVTLFAGRDGTERYGPDLNAGAGFEGVEALWDDLANLARYDLVLLSCEGYRYSQNKSVGALQALKDYVDGGGRVFASHFHHYWFEHGPAPWPDLATFAHKPFPPSQVVTTLVDTFEGGKRLADWLLHVGGSPVYGQMIVRNGRRTVSAVDEALARSWILLADSQGAVDSVQYLSFETPLEVPEEERCGRVVFSDLHVSGSSDRDRSAPWIPFPAGCRTADLTPQEKALLFMLFDLSSCLAPPIL